MASRNVAMSYPFRVISLVYHIRQVARLLVSREGRHGPPRTALRCQGRQAHRSERPPAALLGHRARMDLHRHRDVAPDARLPRGAPNVSVLRNLIVGLLTVVLFVPVMLALMLIET